MLCALRTCRSRAVLVTKYYPGDQIEENERGGAYGAYGGQDRCIQGIGGGNLREKTHLEGLGVDGKIVLKWKFKKWNGELWTGLIWLRVKTNGGLF